MKTHKLHYIEKIFPLPPKEKRRLWPFFASSKILKQSDVNRDSDYLFYQAGAIIEKISLLTLVTLLIDVYTGTEVLLNQQQFLENTSEVLSTWGKVMSPTVLFVGWLAYFRARLPLNIQKDQITFMVDKKFWRKYDGRRYWCQMSAMISILGLVIFPLCAGNFSVDEHSSLARLHIHDNAYCATILLSIFAVSIGLFTTLSLSCALIWEKTYRFYEEAKKDFKN